MPFNRNHLEELADACRKAAAGEFVPSTDQICCGVPIVEFSVTRDLARFAEMWTMPDEASRELKILYAEALHAFDIPLLEQLRLACDLEIEAGYYDVLRLHDRIVIYLGLLTDDPAHRYRAARVAFEMCTTALTPLPLRYRARCFALAFIERYVAIKDMYARVDGFEEVATRLGHERHAALHGGPMTAGEQATLAAIAQGIVDDDGHGSDFGLGDAEIPDDEEGEEEARREIEEYELRTHVVVSTIGESGSKVAEIRNQFGRHVGQRLPLVERPDVEAVYRKLVAEAPHLAPVIEAVLTDVAASDTIRFRPCMFLGGPGSGKTRLARRFAEELQLPYRIVPAAGQADGAIGGTSRQWSTGRPCAPFTAVTETGVANPLVIVDEVEKAGASRHNGNLSDTLLGFLEPENARSFHDPFLEAPVDLSRVLWILTANGVQGLHPALLDRCRVFVMPDPSPEHLPVLMPSIVREILREQGLDVAWARSLSGTEIEFVETLWQGGSVRRLKAAVAEVLRRSERILAN